LTHSSQIGTVLRDMAWQKCLLNVLEGRLRDRDVDPACRSGQQDLHFRLVPCRWRASGIDVVGAERLFRPAARVPVNFIVGTPGATRFEGGPAFIADFPEKLYHFQRRRHFRARTLLTKGYRCELRIPETEKQALQLDIADLSLSGVGLRSRRWAPTSCPWAP
jgi:hypothetical protein